MTIVEEILKEFVDQWFIDLENNDDGGHYDSKVPISSEIGEVYEYLRKELTTLETKVREEERKRDLKFLKEMRGYAGTPTDLVNWEMVTKMIDDWIAELSQESED